MAKQKSSTKKIREAPSEFVESVKLNALRAAWECLRTIKSDDGNIEPHKVRKNVISAAQAASKVVGDAKRELPDWQHLYIGVEWIVASAFWAAVQDIGPEDFGDVAPESRGGCVMLGFAEACICLELRSQVSAMEDEAWEMGFD